MQTGKPIDTLPLFPILEGMLQQLLLSLTDEEWQLQTVASRWKVKDVAAHLLDGNLRSLSSSRDHYFGAPVQISSYGGLVDYINQLNMDWTNAAARLSPRILTGLLASSGAEYIDHLRGLDPQADAIYPVAWAGQGRSPNWFHIAREYTEKFLHQQQIRDATGRPGLITRELFRPFIDIMMYAFPHTFRDVPARNGTTVSIHITGEAGGTWSIRREHEQWVLLGIAVEADTTFAPDNAVDTTATIESGIPTKTGNTIVTMEPDTAWKLFSRSWKPADVSGTVSITGDPGLAAKALEMVAVMA